MAKGIRIRRTASVAVVSKTYALPVQFTHFGNQTRMGPSMVKILKLDALPLAPLQDYTTGKTGYMLDYDGIDTAPIG